jgi:hypothetical protein
MDHTLFMKLEVVRSMKSIKLTIEPILFLSRPEGRTFNKASECGMHLSLFLGNK